MFIAFAYDTSEITLLGFHSPYLSFNTSTKFHVHFRYKFFPFVKTSTSVNTFKEYHLQRFLGVIRVQEYKTKADSETNLV